MSISTANANIATLNRFLFNASGSETSLSGVDANGNTLSYTVGKEQVFLNGVMLVRGTDYVATTGTSITGLTALSASDVVEIIAYGTFVVATAMGAAQTTPPTAPVEGLIWLDTDGVLPSTSVIRWSKQPSAGTTSLSGNDDNSVPLAYSVGYEQVFLNGTLLSKGNDYTATTGTSITLTNQTITGDIVEVISPLQIQTTDTYTQSAVNAAFVANTNANMAGKNAVINGGMDIWQRGTSIAIAASTAPSSSTYTADRWQTGTNANQAITISRQSTSDATNLPNIQYCLRFQRNSGQTGTTGLSLVQSFETVNSIPLAGKTITLSFYARAGSNYSATSNAFNYAVWTGTGTDQNRITAAYTGDASPLGGTATLTTTWQRFTASATLASTITELAVAFSFIPVGTAGTNDYFEITGVQLELGSNATAFSRNQGTYQAELAACQRYYWRQTAGSSYGIFGVGPALSTTQVKAFIPFPVTARNIGASSALEFSNIATYDGVTITAITAAVYSENNQNASNIQVTVASGLTQYRPYEIIANNNTAAYIAFSSEL